jgi:hypothetical protein
MGFRFGKMDETSTSVSLNSTASIASMPCVIRLYEAITECDPEIVSGGLPGTILIHRFSLAPASDKMKSLHVRHISLGNE